MPTVAENLFWERYTWPQQGDEWSAEWGNTETEWHATLLPRIRRFLPAVRVLEIAPGHGRWSSYLIANANAYIGIDLNAGCIASCQARFNTAKNAKFFVNDGKSLPMVDDGSIDFAFSFDSLVHVEMDVIETYLRELSRTLSPNGIAFIHHSNLGEYNNAAITLARALGRLARRSQNTLAMLQRLQLADWRHWRAISVTSQRVLEASRTTGLACIGQEIINWGRHNRRMIDCISLFTRPGSKWDRPNVVVRNPHFMAEARSAQAVLEVYGS